MKLQGIHLTLREYSRRIFIDQPQVREKYLRNINSDNGRNRIYEIFSDYQMLNAGDALGHSFNWENTPEGDMYWQRLNVELNSPNYGLEVIMYYL